MIAFADMLVKPARQAGIKTPVDPEAYDPERYPHWHVYLNAQLGAPMPNSTSHWTNARVVAGVPEGELRAVTMWQLIERGFEITFNDAAGGEEL